MTLKLEDNLDILQMYPHTENEAASLRHSKLRAWIEKNTKICLKVKMSKALNYFERYRNRYSDQMLPTFKHF